MSFYETFLKTLTALLNLMISLINLSSINKNAKSSSDKEELSTQKKELVFIGGEQIPPLYFFSLSIISIYYKNITLILLIYFLFFCF